MNLDKSELLVMAMIATTSGCLVGLSRILNSKISLVFGPIPSSILNHLVGFLFLIFLISITIGFRVWPDIGSTEAIYYLGGALGVIFVALNNYLIPKIGVTQTVILVTGGQMLGSYLIDAIIRQDPFSWLKFVGVILVAFGVIYSARKK